MLLKYTSTDYPCVLALWQEAFGDSKADIDACLSLFSQHLYLYKINGELLSMQMRLPLSYGDKKGQYIYAVATKKEARGLGLATKMLDAAKQQVDNNEVDFLVLVPAKSSLFDFYKARGFVAGSPINTLTLNGNCTNKQIKITPVSPSIYFNLRNKHLQPLAAWDTAMLTDIETLYGTSFFQLENKNGYGFCMAYKQNDKLIVSELYLNSEQYYDALAGLCKHFSTSTAEAKVFCAQGAPFAMFYPKRYANLYFNLAIN